MKKICITGLEFKNFIQGLERLGYKPKWNFSDADGYQYTDAVSSSGLISPDSIYQVSDLEVVTLDGHIDLGFQAGCFSIQNTLRRWRAGTLPAYQIKEPSVIKENQMTLLEQTILDCARGHLAALNGFFAKIKTGKADEDDRSEFSSRHSSLYALLELGHLHNSGMSVEGCAALLSIEKETAEILK
jgi:hypothetical protein